MRLVETLNIFANWQSGLKSKPEHGERRGWTPMPVWPPKDRSRLWGLPGPSMKSFRERPVPAPRCHGKMPLACQPRQPCDLSFQPLLAPITPPYTRFDPELLDRPDTRFRTA